MQILLPGYTFSYQNIFMAIIFKYFLSIVPVEDSALREMAEYMEANRDEILDKLPGTSNVTLLVFREGDKLNFFRVVDPRPDGSCTPEAM